MSWEIIDVNSNPEGAPWVRVGCSGVKARQVQFTMSRSVVRHLGAEDGTKLEVLRGYDDHDGWVCIVRGPDGFMATARNMGKGNLALRMSARHLGVTERHSSVKVDGESLVFADGGCVYVELPDWARRVSP
jgi:hypothetical protein